MDYLVLALATWRISSLIVNEDGPYKLCKSVREWLQRTISAELFNCLWCASVWVAIALTIAYWYVPELTIWLMLPFALSALAIALDKWNG